MEQFDTDDKLIENSKDKKGKKEKKCTTSHYFLIVLCCIFAFCAFYFMFKYYKSTSPKEIPIDSSNT